MGDFNIDIMTNCKIKLRCLFLNLLNSFVFHINFTTPTRISVRSATCIDKIITNFKIEELGLSDHKDLIVPLVPRIMAGQSK